jgi:hypothetical protein
MPEVRVMLADGYRQALIAAEAVLSDGGREARAVDTGECPVTAARHDANMLSIRARLPDCSLLQMIDMVRLHLADLGVAATVIAESGVIAAVDRRLRVTRTNKVVLKGACRPHRSTGSTLSHGLAMLP